MNRFCLRYSIIAMLVLSLGLTGCTKQQATGPDSPLVRTQTVKLGSDGNNAQYAGEVKGRYETPLAFQVDGKILRRAVEVGSKVQPGDVLMEIDARDIQQNVSMSGAQVAAAESQLRLAQSNLNRYRTLFEQGAVSQAQLDQFQNAYDVAREAVNQAAAQNAQGTNQLGYSTLVADAPGIIAAIHAEAGQVVSAGQAVITLVKDGEREVVISVPENRVEQIVAGKPVLVNFWALQGVVLQGMVREVSPVPDKISRTYKVRISLVSPPPEVNLGMTASVTVNDSSNQQGIQVPLSAVYQTGDQPNVWVVQQDKVTLRPVQIGRFSDNGVLVLEGLKDGEVIVTAGVQKLTEGQKVRI